MSLSSIPEFAKMLGLKNIKEKGDEIYSLCPFHDDEHIGSFSINRRTGKYWCFACMRGGSILQYGYEKGIGLSAMANLWNLVKLDIVDDVYIPALPLDSALVRSFKKNGLSEYARTRISSEILKEYEVYSDDQGNPIFFVLDFQGNYRAVWVRDESIESKYYLIDPPTQKRDGYLFGQHIRGTQYTVITEGFFDAMAIRERLGQRGVCMNGLSITDMQVKTLHQLQPLYLFTDGDARGKEARSSIYKKLKKLDVRICGGYTGDADNYNKEQLEEIIRNAKNKIDWELYQRSRVGK